MSQKLKLQKKAMILYMILTRRKHRQIHISIKIALIFSKGIQYQIQKKSIIHDDRVINRYLPIVAQYVRYFPTQLPELLLVHVIVWISEIKNRRKHVLFRQYQRHFERAVCQLEEILQISDEGRTTGYNISGMNVSHP